jgi:conjugative transfer signal peptidase TraF
MKRKITLGIGAVSIGLIALSSVLSSHEVLIWNRTESAPKGLYWRSDSPLTLNGWAVVSGKAPSSMWISERGYLAPGWPIIKRVRAQAGDKVCRENQIITINNERVADALEADSSGVALPVWGGCLTLKAEEVFLLNDHPRSLDGRYFGPTNVKDVRGSASLLFAHTD